MPANAQVAIGYFPFQSILSVASNPEKALFADFKMETNNFITNMNMEFSPKINMQRTHLHTLYAGAGIVFNPANKWAGLPVSTGYFIDFGVRAKPLKNQAKLQVVFEVSPYVNRTFSSGNFRTRLGIAWNFNPGNRNTISPE